MPPSSKSTLWITLILLLGVLAAPAGCLAWKRARDRRIAENESHVTTDLLKVGSAMERVRDLRRSGTLAWDGTLAGLNEAVFEKQTPLKLLSAELASADPGRPGARPHHGYWFVLLPTEGAWSACAYPARYPSTGRLTYLISDTRGQLRADTEGVPPARSPKDGEIWGSKDP